MDAFTVLWLLYIVSVVVGLANTMTWRGVGEGDEYAKGLFCCFMSRDTMDGVALTEALHYLEGREVER